MSIVCAGYGAVSLPTAGSNCSFAGWTFGINALARLIDIASKLGSHILCLIVGQKKKEIAEESDERRKFLKIGHTTVHNVMDLHWVRTSHIGG
jgi:hypothetical protein